MSTPFTSCGVLVDVAKSVGEVILFAFALAVVAACNYNPSFRDCEIACTSATGCPSEFSCSTWEGKCRAEGASASCELMPSSFSAVVGFPGSPSLSIAIGDINGDGKLDLVTANSGTNTVSVLLNTTTLGATTPSFALKVDFPTGMSPRSVALGDMNGDGKLDLVVTNVDGTGLNGTISVLLNTSALGATTTTFAPKADFPGGAAPSGAAVAIGDVNGDGKPDIAATDGSTATVSVLINTTAVAATSPTFAAKVDFTTGANPGPVAFGDVNGDGKPDLAVVNLNQSVSILLNTTVGATPSFAMKVDFSVGGAPGTGTPASVALGDLNGDGKADLAVANATNPGSVSILSNTTDTGATTPSFAAKVNFTAGASSSAAVLGNLNADGKLDIAVANGGDNTVSIFFNTTAADATPSFAAKADFPAGADPQSIAIGDLNGDGKLDLAVTNSDDGTISVLVGQ